MSLGSLDNPQILENTDNIVLVLQSLFCDC